jgi:hypothetical protein
LVRGVSSSLGLKWLLLILLLAMSLGWKLAVRPGNQDSPDGRAFQLRIAEFLNRQRLIVSVGDRFEEGQPSIRANTGSCRILVVRSPAIGWDRDVIRRHASPDDEVFVVYRGKIYQEQPTLQTALDFLWTRLWRELGIYAYNYPIIAVIASKGCDARMMPWEEVS